MPDTLGRVPVPSSVSSGATFPLVSEYGYGFTQDWSVISHSFGSLATLGSQRYGVGSGARKFTFVKQHLSIANRKSLLDFYSLVQGSYQSFVYPVPNPDRASFTNYTTIFDTPPLSVTDLANSCQTGINFIEIIDPSSAPVYSVSATVTRFPSSTLADELLSQVQEIVPLLRIRVLNPAVPDIYLSDRRCTVAGQLYLPRLLNIGEPGSDVIMSQSIDGAADNVRFTFGNSDRVMSALVNDCGLRYATVELSLYHVNSSVLLQLWSGVALSWTVDGSNQFSLQCTDGLYQITQQYPRRVTSRRCWKKFNDGRDCPWATTPGHIGNATSCDFGFNTSNGCLSHGMSLFFGGQFSLPQTVITKDKGEIFGGFGRSIALSTSIVSDSMYGRPLAEIWANDDGDPGKAFIADAQVVAVRDENTFEDTLGIVGSGPLGAYSGMSVQTNADGYKFIVAPTADGFTPQGFQVNSQLVITGFHPTLGLREVLGTDPAVAATDAFSLGQGNPQRWDVPDPTFANIITGQTHDIIPFAAGVAFVELRYAKSPGPGGDLVPTTAESHSMSVPISQGLTGYTFDMAHVRTAVPGLTNPFWVAVNTYLRAIGWDKETAANQLTKFVLDSLVASDGSGTGSAEIADFLVPPLIGPATPLEKQFRFQGSIAEFKPFRAWLTEILSCALGYYTFEFGRLRLGIRANASVVSAFTLGNILFQSLSLTPAESEFEYMRIDFANQALQYQQDYVEYEDKDHSAYCLRTGSPLSARTKSVGLSSISQGLRVVSTRVREEIGGIYRADQSNPYIEWDNNNIASFRTTLLALGTAVGQVISITHPDVPTYPGLTSNTWKFRINRWSLHKDWSITVTAKSVTDSMYDLDLGPRPFDATPTPLPVLFFSEPLGQWAPYQSQYPSADALFPSEYTFDLSQSYLTLRPGSAQARLTIAGKLPVDQFIPNCGAVDVKKGSVTQSATGGTIRGGLTYRLQLCVTNSIGQFSPPSDILIVQVPAGTNTNQFTIVNIQWPNISGLTGYVVFVSDVDELICGQSSGSLSGTAPAYTPSSLTLSTAFARSTYGVPNNSLSKLRVRGRRLIHGGPAGAGVTSRSGSTLIASDLIDVTLADDWTGRVLSVIGRTTGVGPDLAPLLNFNVTAFDPATGEFTLDRNVVTAGVLDGDAFVLTFLGYDNSSTPRVLTDPMLENATNMHAGEAVDDPNRIGNTIIVIKGLNRGGTAKIVSNTVDSYTLDRDLVIDSTSVWIVATAAWEILSEVPIANADPLQTTQVNLDAPNYDRLPLLIGGFVVDNAGNETLIGSAPLRMIYVFGAQGTRLIAASTVMLGTDGTVDCDTSGITGTATTLDGGIDDTVQDIVVTSGAAILDGEYIEIGTERMYVVSGGTTNALHVERGGWGTTAAAHSDLDVVGIPGVLTFTCLEASEVADHLLIVRKRTSDLNVVKVLPGGSDLFPGGSASIILADDTSSRGVTQIKFPGVP